MWLLKNAVDGDEKLELVEEAKPEDDETPFEYTPQNRPDGDLDRSEGPFDLAVLEDVIAMVFKRKLRVEDY